MSIDTGSIAFLPGLSGLEGGVRRGVGTVSGIWTERPKVGRANSRSLWRRETSATVYRRRGLKRREAEVVLSARRQHDWSDLG